MSVSSKIKLFSFLLAVILFTPYARSGSGYNMADTLRFEVLLSEQMMKSANINESLLKSLEVTPSRYILLATDNQFYLLGWGGIEPLGNKTTGKISSYAFTSDKLLMVARAEELCGMDADGNLSKIFTLPSSDMGIATGKYAMYVYDRSTAKTGHSVFLITHGGQHAKLFEMPTPINSVVEYGNSLLLASGNAIFRYNFKEKEFKLFAALPEDQAIRSIALDTLQNRVYFSTDNMIYGLKESSAVIISDQIGGLIRYFNGGLIVFNPEKKFIIRVLGIEGDLAMKKQNRGSNNNLTSSSGMLNNSIILNLVKAKISDDEIIDLINSSPGSYNTSVDSMIYLSDRNVSSKVILAMRNAARLNKKQISGPDKISKDTPPETQLQAEGNTAVQGTSQANRFFIITGSFPNEKEAEQAVEVLKGKGYADASVVGTNSSGSYRIACKSYPTGEAASKELPEIKKSLNSTAWIFEKK